MATLLAHFRPASTLAFCNTKIRSHDLVERLRAQASKAPRRSTATWSSASAMKS